MISIMLVTCGFVLGMACLAGFVEAELARKDRQFERQLRPWLTKEGASWDQES